MRTRTMSVDGVVADEDADVADEILAAMVGGGGGGGGEGGREGWRVDGRVGQANGEFVLFVIFVIFASYSVKKGGNWLIARLIRIRVGVIPN